MKTIVITFFICLLPACASKGSAADAGSHRAPTPEDTSQTIQDGSPTSLDTSVVKDGSQSKNNEDINHPEGKDTKIEDPSQGAHEVKACQGPAGVEQSCFWTHRYDPDKCKNGCSKLVIYYAGGVMNCPDPADETSYLGKYSGFGYVAVCARLFQDPAGAAKLPYTLEAERVDMLLQDITSNPIIQSAWTGQHLLVTGASHGATAPVTAMFRTALDEKPYWKGDKLTAACFLDGTYDISETLQFLHKNECKAPVSYERIYSRYCQWTGGAEPDSWPLPNTCTAPEVDLDTVVNADPSELSIKHWKLVECGSEMAPCTDDVFPKAPIETLCSNIDGSQDKSCEYKSYKNSSHATCGITLTNYGVCRQWFGELIQAL